MKQKRNLTKIVRAFKRKYAQTARTTTKRLENITVIECFDVEKPEEVTERHQLYERVLQSIPTFEYFSFSSSDRKTNVGIADHCDAPNYYTTVQKVRAYLEGLTESRVIYLIGHGSESAGLEIMRYDDHDVCSAITVKQQNPKGNAIICYAAKGADPTYCLELSKLKLRVPQLIILEMCFSGKLVPPRFTFPRNSKLQLIFAKDKTKQDLNGSTLKDYTFNQRVNEYVNTYVHLDGVNPNYMRIDPTLVQKRISPRDKMDVSDSNSSSEFIYSDTSAMSQGGKNKRSKYARRRSTVLSYHSRHARTKRVQ